jgi:predicted nucleic acid-binding protein
MTENISLQFVDTNILIYSYDTEGGDKFEAANHLLKSLWKQKNGCISMQVLQEFYVNITRKTRKPLSTEAARLAVIDFSQWKVHRPEVDDVLAAIDIEQRFQISFWDALVIRSAQRLGCKTLWSEDLSAGQDYDGVVVKNPLLA